MEQLLLYNYVQVVLSTLRKKYWILQGVKRSVLEGNGNRLGVVSVSGPVTSHFLVLDYVNKPIIPFPFIA